MTDNGEILAIVRCDILGLYGYQGEYCKTECEQRIECYKRSLLNSHIAG